MTGPIVPPQGFPPDTVMTQDQCAAALGCSVDTLVRSGLPATYALGSRQPRYIWKHVIGFMEKGLAA